MSTGTLYGVGLGPGDPDLMSLRAHRLLTAAGHVAYFRKAGRSGQARRIVEGLLRQDVTEFAMEYPVTTEIPLSDPRYNDILANFYARCAKHVLDLLGSGQDVVVLCEGDPFFYGSFMYVFARLSGKYQVEVVPGVTSITACAASAGMPLAARNERLTVLPGPLPADELRARIDGAESVVIMKVGRHMAKIRNVIDGLGLTDHAVYVERATLPQEVVLPLADAPEKAPYFSMILLTKGADPWL
jgi:precorrin-2/cobalt-factor-2 C20-methyltransferase